MRRGTAVLLVVALLAATVALVVAQARTWPGPPTDTNPRANTPNDHDFDYAEPDDEDGDYMPNAASVFDEDHRLFGFAPNDTKTTALYDIEASGLLLSQAPPNDGVLNTIGSLGLKLDGATAFNIVAQGEDNAAWLVTGATLYSVDLKTGKATAAGKLEGVKGKLTDIAWVD